MATMDVTLECNNEIWQAEAYLTDSHPSVSHLFSQGHVRISGYL